MRGPTVKCHKCGVYGLQAEIWWRAGKGRSAYTQRYHKKCIPQNESWRNSPTSPENKGGFKRAIGDGPLPI